VKLQNAIETDSIFITDHTVAKEQVLDILQAFVTQLAGNIDKATHSTLNPSPITTFYDASHKKPVFQIGTLHRQQINHA